MPAEHYCTIDDVNALVPQAPFSASSKPTQAQVEAFIEDVAQRIDATIGNVGYVVPVVAGDKALRLLKEACAWGALGLAQTVRETAAKVAISDRGQPIDNIWTLKFDRWLKALASSQDPFELPDAERTTERVIKQQGSLVRSHVQGDVATFVTNPVVQRYQVL